MSCAACEEALKLIVSNPFYMGGSNARGSPSCDGQGLLNLSGDVVMIHRMVVSVLLISLLSLTVACGDDSSGSQYERPAATQDIISDAELQRAMDEGFELYEGTNPPSLSGVYETVSEELGYHDNEVRTGQSICDYRWYFEQSVDTDFDYSITREYTSCDGNAQGMGSYISGEGNCFSMYARTEGQFEGCETEAANVISGCLEEDGIHDFQRLLIATNERTSEECQAVLDDDRMSDTGEMGIYVETDGLAERVGDIED